MARRYEIAATLARARPVIFACSVPIRGRLADKWRHVGVPARQKSARLQRGLARVGQSVELRLNCSSQFAAGAPLPTALQYKLATGLLE